VIGPADHPNAPGLFFIGYSHPLSGNIRDMALDARRIASTVRTRRRGRSLRIWRREFDYRTRRRAIPRAHSSLTSRAAPAADGRPSDQQVMQPTVQGEG
jgi:hypothetical protein